MMLYKQLIMRWLTKGRLYLLAISTTAAIAGGSAPAIAQTCEAQLIIASVRHAVPVDLLTAIGRVESNFRPLALNIGGRSYQPASPAEAMRLLSTADGTPRRNATVGCMQIHTWYHRAAVDGQIERFLDPAVNVDYSAQLLRLLYDRHGSWRLAVGWYHTAASSSRFELYICRIDEELRTIGSDLRLGCAD